MASIEILEKDSTNSAIYSPTETVVYIPGMLGQNGDATILGKPILYSDETTFTANVGTAPQEDIQDEGTSIEYDKSYVMAKQLIANGMKVLYEAVADSEGNEVKKKADMVAILQTSSHWQKLCDKSLYNIRFITSGGYSAIQNMEPAAESIATNMIDCAAYNSVSKQGRGDCVALIDHPKDVSNITQVYNLFNGASSFALGLTGDVGSFAAAFTPWADFACTADLGGIEESDGSGNVWTLPGSMAYLLSYNQSIANNPTWYAAAGISRGNIPLLSKPLFDIGELASQTIQSREEGTINVNPITYINGYGYRIWGNRTLRQIVDGLKASSFLNVRVGVCDIKKTINVACKIQTFEQNTDILWANLKARITPLLDTMASGQGISGYKLTRVATNEKAKLVAKVVIVPVEAVEDFQITVELVDSVETTIEG